MQNLIKIYGERNTNTRYLSRLIALNLETEEVPGVVPKKIWELQQSLPGREWVRDLYFRLSYGKTLGWKHSRVKPKEALAAYPLVRSKLVFLTITKNPYSWLLSLHRRPYHQYPGEQPSLETFLQRRWDTLRRDNIDHKLANPIELWNVKNRSYLQLDEAITINTTTEQIFKGPEDIIEELSERFSIRRKSDDFVNLERSTKEVGKDSAYYKDYYLNEKWREKLSSEAISIINESVDRDLMSHFGYRLIPS